MKGTSRREGGGAGRKQVRTRCAPYFTGNSELSRENDVSKTLAFCVLLWYRYESKGPISQTQTEMSLYLLDQQKIVKGLTYHHFRPFCFVFWFEEIIENSKLRKIITLGMSLILMILLARLDKSLYIDICIPYYLVSPFLSINYDPALFSSVKCILAGC